MHVDYLPETLHMTFNAINTGGDQGLVAAFRPVFSNRILFHLKTQKLEARDIVKSGVRDKTRRPSDFRLLAERSLPPCEHRP